MLPMHENDDEQQTRNNEAVQQPLSSFTQLRRVNSEEPDDGQGESHGAVPVTERKDGLLLANTIRPKPVEDYTGYISRVSSNRRYGFDPQIMKCMEQTMEDTVFLASGLPNSSTFPIVDLAFSLKDGTQITLGPELTSTGMQYGVTHGYKPLLDLIEEFIRLHHQIETDRMDRYKLMVVSGAQDALSKTIEAVLDEGDCVVTEEHPSSAIRATLGVVNPTYIPVQRDQQHGGLKPDSLRQAMVTAGTRKRMSSTKVEGGEQGANDRTTHPAAPSFKNEAVLKHKPKLLLLPENEPFPLPSTLGLPASRTRWVGDQRELYQVCQQNDMLLLEVEHISLPMNQSSENKLEPTDTDNKDGQTDLPISRSFLSIDVDCRVFHIGDFSQVIGPGSNLGYLIGPRPIVERVAMHQQVTWDHSPTLTQILLHQLLTHWGWPLGQISNARENAEER